MTKDVLGEALRAQVRQAGNAVSVLQEAARDAVDEQQPDALLGIAVDYTAARGEQAAAMRITSAYEAGGLVEARRVSQIVADELGVPFEIVEKNAEIGGTWYVNRYPGCGVDTPNHSYSFSFGKRNPWTRYFAQRQELQRVHHADRRHLAL